MKPHRSVLSVPGHQSKMHEKARLSPADVIMFDLEDSVPATAKAEARQCVIHSLLHQSWDAKTISVRVNGADTPFAYRDIVEILEAAGDRIDTLVLPKVNHPGEVHFASILLDQIQMAAGTHHRVMIEASIETAAGINKVEEIATSSSRLLGLVFGIADYAASVGARLVSLSGHGEREEEIYPGHRWHYPLSRMIAAAKAHHLLAIDAPYGNFTDTQGLRRSAEIASALGCDGKWAIHPSQINTINEIFSPTTEDLQRARRILDAAQHAQTQGLGAVSVDGRMVDQATVRLARNLLEQARHLGLGPEFSDKKPAP